MLFLWSLRQSSAKNFEFHVSLLATKKASHRVPDREDSEYMLTQILIFLQKMENGGGKKGSTELLWFCRGDGVVRVCYHCVSACASVQKFNCSFYAKLL